MVLPRKLKLKGRKFFRRLHDYEALNFPGVFRVYFQRKLENQVSGTGLQCRYGVVVSKKVFRLACDRNWARRRLEEALRIALPQLRDAFDRFEYLIFVLRADIAKVSFTELCAKLNNLAKGLL